VGVNVVDTKPEEEDFSFTVVPSGCSTVIEAIKAINPEFVKLIKAIPDVTPTETYAIFEDTSAMITVLVPPRTSTNGLLYGYEQGDVSKEEVRVLRCVGSEVLSCCISNTCLSLLEGLVPRSVCSMVLVIPCIRDHSPVERFACVMYMFPAVPDKAGVESAPSIAWISTHVLCR
jgi:hypothetical protein